jgi:transposase-like protein
MSLTDEQKQAFIKAGGVCCPLCGSSNIEGGFIEVDAGRATQRITCPDCGRHWTDVYCLTEIVPDE